MKIRSKSTKRLFCYSIVFAVALFGAGLTTYLASRNSTTAVSATDFKAGYIVSDYVFYNKNSMNAQQIQDFLNRLIPVCQTWKNTIFTEADGQRVGPPFVCLNNYHENPSTGETSFERGGGAFAGGISAAQIIYDAAQKYNINPQVLLVMLRKESSGPLTRDNWPTKRQYRYAMGYACPDSGPNNTANCNSQKAGFYKQVNLAAWQLKYYRDHPNDYRYKIGWNDIQYSPNVACGTKRVYIENIATLSLYIYTPYTPNDGALANYPGTAPCGAYGNRNFFMFFSEWFGSTLSGDGLDMLKADQDITSVYNSHRDRLGAIRTDKIPEFDSSPRVWQTFENGTIIWTRSTGAHVIFFGDIFNRWKQLGGSAGTLGVPTGEAVTEGSDNRTWQTFRSGIIIHSKNTGAWDLQNGPIFNKWRESGGSLGQLGKPTSGVIISNTMRKQNFERGSIIRRSHSSPAHIVKDNIHKTWSTSENQSILKVPTGDQVIESDGRIWQYFDGGLAMQIGDSVYIIESGVFHNTWKSAGGSSGALGKPTSNKATESGRSWQAFERGIILRKQNSSVGYAMYYGEVYNRWRQTGGSNGILGLPTSNIYNESDGRTWQAFEQGYIISSKATGAWDVVGGFYTFWKSQGGSLGKLGKPTSSRNIEPDGTRWQTFERGKAVWSPTKGWSITGI